MVAAAAAVVVEAFLFLLLLLLLLLPSLSLRKVQGLWACIGGPYLPTRELPKPCELSSKLLAKGVTKGIM